MRSAFDNAVDQGLNKGWNGREWYVIKNAEVQVSEDDVLIPRVKMGIEARDQIFRKDGMHDAPITKPDHPLVKYAEAFTRNFDLIAERRSVVFQLREVAKATVIAKFLTDAKVHIDESWLDLAEEARPDESPMEIP